VDHERTIVRPISRAGAAALALPLLLAPLGCGSDDSSAADTEAAAEEEAPAETAATDEPAEAAEPIGCQPDQLLAAAAEQFGGYSMSDEVCVGTSAVASLDRQDTPGLVGFFSAEDGEWALLVAGPAETYNAGNLPEGVSLLAFQRWQQRSAPPTVPGSTPAPETTAPYTTDPATAE
jgi:hypothetical protein